MDGIKNINQVYVNYFVKKSQNTIHKLFPGNFQVLKYTTVTKMKMCASISVFTEKLSLHWERVFSKVRLVCTLVERKVNFVWFHFLIIFSNYFQTWFLVKKEWIILCRFQQLTIKKTKSCQLQSCYLMQIKGKNNL